MIRPALLPAGTSSRAYARLLSSLSLSLTIALSACGPRTGDFGRPLADPVSLRALAGDAGTAAARIADADAWASGAQALEKGFIRSANRILGEPNPEVAPDHMTAVERDLRQRLWHFRQDVPDWPQTTPNARYNALADAIAVDAGLLPALVEMRLLVREKDHIRARALPAFAGADKDMQAHVATIAADNAARIAEICRHARHRAVIYRRELERLVLTAPEDEAIAVERGLTRLDGFIRTVCDPPRTAARTRALVRK